MNAPSNKPAVYNTGQGIPEYLAALASSAPAPGGGSAAGLVGAIGVALISMVANLTAGRPRFANVEPQMQAALAEATRLRADLVCLMEDDARAFEALTAARRLPHTDDEEKRARRRAIQLATQAAAAPPLAMATACRRALDLAGVVARDGNEHLASDAGVAALLAEAALRASAINVRVNLAALRDKTFVETTEAELNRLLEGTPMLAEEILAIAGRRMVGT